MRPDRPSPTPAAPRLRPRDWLIAFLLALATIQTARADFFVNDTFLDWRQYALGRAPLPYQGRALLVPVLRWAGDNPTFRRLAARYAVTVQIGTLFYEPITPEKFVSLLLGLLSLSALMLAAFWWSRRRALSPWWLPNLLVLVITGVTVALRATTNYWYAYDLPHAALFGIGALLALEGLWLPALLCFAIDVPLRETSLFSILMFAPVFFVQGAHLLRRQHLPQIAGVISTDATRHRSGETPASAFARAQTDLRAILSPANRPALLRTLALAAGMGLFWAAVRLAIARHYAGNLNQTYPRLGQNLHEILFPHHWPQLFSAGGYLPLLVWLDRRVLPLPERALLYGSVACIPVTLWFGVWTETRVWLEWTLPLAALASLQLIYWLQTRTPTPTPQPS